MLSIFSLGTQTILHYPTKVCSQKALLKKIKRQLVVACNQMDLARTQTNNVLGVQIVEFKLEIYQSMGFLRKIRELVKTVDFFYSTDMLRYDEDQDYKTLTGGIISIGILAAIVIGFASMILSTFNQTSISTATQVTKNQIPPSSTLEIKEDSYFRFAMEIWRVNLSDSIRYFDFTLSRVQQVNGIIVNTDNIPLVACTKEYFKNYPDVVNGFDNLQAGGWMCPSMNTTYQLYGKYSSESYSQYVVTVSACQNSTDPSRPCASPSQIQQFFETKANFLYFTFYFTNPQINPDQKQYKQYYLQDMSYVIFGSGMGSETFLYFSDYTIKTDYSIWPYESVQEDKGCIVEDLAVNHNFQTNINGTFVTFYLAKSSNSITYVRQVQKLSAVLSFMGGMIGSVSAVLYIFKLYTKVAFQFSISQQIFKPDNKREDQQNEKGIQNAKDQRLKFERKEERIKHVDMNFWNFIKYYLFILSNMIGKPLKWPNMEYAHKCKREISKQLDVKVLLKRIIFLEHCLTYLMEDFQLDAIQMKKPFSPESISVIREKCQAVIDKENFQSSSSDSSSQKEIMRDQFYPNLNQASPKQIISNCHLVKHSSIIGTQDRKLRPSVQNTLELFRNNKVGVLEDIENSSEGSHQNYKQMKMNLDMVRQIPESSRKKRRQSYLRDLMASKEKGNPLSAKIWMRLDQKTRKQIQQKSRKQISGRYLYPGEESFS